MLELADEVISNHFIVYCSECKGVVIQCTCEGPKQVSYGLCSDCKTKLNPK